MGYVKRHIGDIVKAKDEHYGVFKCVITDFTEIAGEYFVKPIGIGYEMVISEEQIID